MNKRLFALIHSSDLAKDEQYRFLGMLRASSELDQKKLAVLFLEDPASLRAVFENFDAKRSAKEDGSVELFEQAIDKEKEFLQNL
ncbi:MAG: hypothetical protein O3B64_00975 [bacterium]|nr:hypothetical protein [bacterium]